MKKVEKFRHSTLFLSFLVFFVLFYPMLISIYVFLPLFIGTMSYMLLQGLERHKPFYLFLAIVYLINLEVNLSLPLFLTIISAFIFYMMVYRGLQHFRRCKLCKPILSVVLIDLFYLGTLFIFDFIFKTHSINLDMMLLYSLVVDMLVVVLL